MPATIESIHACETLAMIGVFTGPGITLFTRMPRGPSSVAAVPKGRQASSAKALRGLVPARLTLALDGQLPALGAASTLFGHMFLHGGAAHPLRQFVGMGSGELAHTVVNAVQGVFANHHKSGQRQRKE